MKNGNNISFTYKEIDRGKLNCLYETLSEIRKEISMITFTPVSKMPQVIKLYNLEDLNFMENYTLREIAKLKGVLSFSKN